LDIGYRSITTLPNDGATMTALLDTLLDDPAVSRLGALVIGMWEEGCTGTDSSSIVEKLCNSANQMASLRSLFLGDIIGEECEISWITQSDITPLFEAYPLLEVFKVRGGNGLQLQSFRHEHLLLFTIESGGLGSEVVVALGESDLPKLEVLDLWLGDSGYGKTTTPQDLDAILDGDAFPALTYLGLRNCEDADAIAAAVANAPIVDRIKVLDLSLGDLTDEGAKSLVESPLVAKLEKLDIHHHFLSPEMTAAIERIGIPVDTSDRQEANEYKGEQYRYIAASE
jgi:hypothetical protein